jgi:diacylglycerol kinase (ATP)
MANRNQTGIRRLLLAFGYSMRGLESTLRHEAAFRQELVLFALLAPTALVFGQTAVERAILIASLFLVLIVEVLNSGIEAVVDRVGEENHPLAGRAKDMGSAAVFLALVNVLVIWAVVFWP